MATNEIIKEGEKELDVLAKEDFDTTDSSARYLGQCSSLSSLLPFSGIHRTALACLRACICAFYSAAGIQPAASCRHGKPSLSFLSSLISPAPLTAYGNRIRTALRASTRYVAFVPSPLIHPQRDEAADLST